MLPWRDALHAGPVPDVDRSEFLRTRARFLAECGFGDEQTLLGELEGRDRTLLEADQVVLWFEHDLYDQLQLIDVLTLLATEEKHVEAIVIGAFPGRPNFRGLGELTAAELETLWPARTPVTPEMLAEAVTAWGLVRSPSPDAIAGTDFTHLPFLSAALTRLHEERPASGGGLSKTERYALTAVANGASSRDAAFLAAQDLEDVPFLGDTWFFRTLDELASRGLIDRADGRLALTEIGRREL